MEILGNWEEPPFRGRPLPDPDALSAEFWSAAAAGELRYQECPQCGHRQHYPRLLCTACGSTPRWQVASGRGTVHTFTVVRKNLAQPFDGLVPYVVAVIDMEEGPRMMGNVTHCEPGDVFIGMDVVAYAALGGPDLGVPFWRPAGTAEPGPVQR